MWECIINFGKGYKEVYEFDDFLGACTLGFVLGKAHNINIRRIRHL